ncbi:MAG: hypothetical protein HFI19_16565 [Lachnospiraceae bacterium]|nr:hypothetical protein [Lachnospiraceae bacterium]
MNTTYFDWLQRETPTRWWHDSGNPDEIDLALKRHAMGVTTNPVLTFRTFRMQPEFWEAEVNKVSQELDFEERAEALLKLVATHAASKVYDIYLATNGEHGYALGQLNPGRAGDYEGMLAQARRYRAWAPNIAIKLPATSSGIQVMEQIAAEGIPICATLNVSVSQALAVAEAYERGRKRAIEKGIKTAPCIAVQQVGRIDDYLRDVAMDMKLDLDERIIKSAGIAIAKRSYQIFQEKGCHAVIMPAGLRGAHHLTALSGGKVIFSMTTRVQDMVLEANPECKEHINEPVADDIMEKLLQIPEFVRAYEIDGMNPQEFITFGVMQKMLSQFMETGWSPLETYQSNKESARWI